MVAESQWDSVERSQLGVKENPPGSNDTPYGVWYGWNGVAWCVIYAMWTLWKAGVQSPIKTASVVALYDWAKANGYLIPSTQAQPGDFILRGWQGIPREAAGFDPDQTHCQELLSVRGSALELEGGNQNDASGGIVSLDTATAGESTILGAVAFSRLYSTPHPGPVHNDPTPPSPKSPSHPNPMPMVYQGVVENGQTEHFIREVQGKVGATVDGNFGPKTDAAVRAFQSKHGLTVDGCVGPKTYAAMGISS